MKLENDFREYSKAEKATLAAVLAIVVIIVISWAADGFASSEGGLRGEGCATVVKIGSIEVSSSAHVARQGVGDGQFRDFVSKLYTKCQKIGFQPERVGSLLDKLSRVSESVPLEQIPEYIKELIDQVDRKKQVHRIELERQLAEERRDIALNEEKTTYGGLNAFVTFRTALERAGLSMSDLPRFVATLTAIIQSGFDPELIAAKLSNLAKAEIDSKAYGERAKFLEEQCKLLEAEKLAHSHSISIYYDLERMMLGIKELKLLWNTVGEIAAANHIPEDRASQKFFADVQTQYDYKLGFKTTLQNLKADIQQNRQLEVQISSTFSIKMVTLVWEGYWSQSYYRDITYVVTSESFFPNSRVVVAPSRIRPRCFKWLGGS